MSFLQIGKVLPAKITDRMVAKLVAEALQQAHPRFTAAVKRIQRVTGANPHSISKWYQGRNAPKSANLLMLARAYPVLLHMLTEVSMGKEKSRRTEKSVRVVVEVSPAINTIGHTNFYTDKFVSINVCLPMVMASQLNQRQLWFIGELQQGRKLNAANITQVWGIHERTARRDIAALQREGILRLDGARKNGGYVLSRHYGTAYKQS